MDGGIELGLFLHLGVHTDALVLAIDANEVSDIREPGYITRVDRAG